MCSGLHLMFLQALTLGQQVNDHRWKVEFAPKFAGQLHLTGLRFGSASSNLDIRVEEN